MNDSVSATYIDDQREHTHLAPVQSILVSAQILELLADTHRPQRVTDIANSLGITKARASRHLNTLAGRGFVTKSPGFGGFSVGPTVFRLAHSAAEQIEITGVAQDAMTALRKRIRESLLLAVPAEGDALVVATLDSGRPLTPRLLRGARLTIPASPTAWVTLAFSPDNVWQRVLRRQREHASSSHGSLRLNVIRARCETIAERFYDFHPDPYDAGFSVLSAPVFNHFEDLDGALTIVMVRRQSDGFTEVRYRSELLRTALDVSFALGSVSMAERLQGCI